MPGQPYTMKYLGTGQVKKGIFTDVKPMSRFEQIESR
jgi:hypothetical protein